MNADQASQKAAQAAQSAKSNRNVIMAVAALGMGAYLYRRSNAENLGDAASRGGAAAGQRMEEAGRQVGGSAGETMKEEGRGLQAKKQ